MSVNDRAIHTLAVLGITFIVLKLCGVIDWAWWIVTLPLWIGFAVAAAIFIAVFTFLAMRKIAKIWLNRHPNCACQSE